MQSKKTQLHMSMYTIQGLKGYINQLEAIRNIYSISLVKLGAVEI